MYFPMMMDMMRGLQSQYGGQSAQPQGTRMGGMGGGYGGGMGLLGGYGSGSGSGGDSP